VSRYRSKISGPLLDRIDIHIEVPKVDFKTLSSAETGESSSAIREWVNRTRERQARRFQGKEHSTMSTADIREHCVLDKESRQLMKQAFDTLGLSARAHDRILKVARTIADLDGAEQISAAHIAEAIRYRALDRKFWE
jgi:magnesium chelatase family protein